MTVLEKPSLLHISVNTQEQRTPLTMKMFVVALAVAGFVAIGEMNHPSKHFDSLALLILISLGLNSSFSLFSSSILLLLLPLY